jgi:hypothetical protein
MSELLCIARLKIHHGKLDEFKHLAARCVELVRTKDTGLCSASCTSTATTQGVLSLSGIVTRRPFWIITRIWGTRRSRFFGHALGLEKYAERLARN